MTIGMIIAARSRKYAVTAFLAIFALSVAASAQEPSPDIQREIERILREALEAEQGQEREFIPEHDADLNPDTLAVAPEAPAKPQKAPDISDWFAELADPEFAGWARAASDIEREWSRSGSPSMDLLAARGESALDEGDIAGAIEDLTALIDHAPDFPKGYALRAQAYYQSGDIGPALADIIKTLTLEPRHYGALALAGQILDETDKSDLALKAYRASLAINPHQTDVQDEIARIEKERAGIAL